MELKDKETIGKGGQKKLPGAAKATQGESVILTTAGRKNLSDAKIPIAIIRSSGFEGARLPAVPLHVASAAEGSPFIAP